MSKQDLTQPFPRAVELPIDWDTYRPFTGPQLVSQVRGWLGTPYHHGAAVRGVGADCTGILIGAARELGVDFNIDMNYGMEDLIESTQALFKVYFHELPACPPNGETVLEEGDIIFFRSRHIYHHVAVYSRVTDTIIHVYRDSGGTVEHHFDSRWRDIVHCVYRFRGLRP